MRRLLFQGLGLSLALSACHAETQAPTHAALPPACSQAPAAGDVEIAKAANKAATKAYERGDYDEAIRQWTDAYRADCTAHGLLVNIGNAYEKKGDKHAAVEAMSAYVKRTGSTPAQAPASSQSVP